MIITDREFIKLILKDPGMRAEAETLIEETLADYNGTLPRFALMRYASSDKTKSFKLVSQATSCRHSAELNSIGLSREEIKEMLGIKELPPLPEKRPVGRPRKIKALKIEVPQQKYTQDYAVKLSQQRKNDTNNRSQEQK